MKKGLCIFFALVLAGPVFSAPSSISLTVSPTNMAWSEQGWLELSVTDIAEEAGVDITLYVDVDVDGLIGSNDFIGAAFGVDDGETNSFGAESFVDDNDGLTNRAIETAISFYGVAYNYSHTIGDYIIQAVEINDSDDGIATTAVPFSVTQPTSTVWVTGVVRDYVSSNVVAGARVEMEYFSGTAGAAPAVWADENGAFTLYVPEGVSISDVAGVMASAAGCFSVEETPDTGDLISFCFFTNALASGENELANPLFVFPAVEEYDLYEISGTVYGIESWDGGAETNPLSGVLVEMEGDDDEDEDDFFSWDVTDEDGSFTMVFPGHSNGVSAEIYCEDPLLNLRGIVGAFVEVEVTGTTSSVDITCYYAEALARATVTDKDTGAPVVGAEVFFESSNTVGDAYTLGNGVYEIGVLAGTYDAEVDDESLEYQYYVEPDWQGGLVISNGTVFTNAPFEVEPGYIIEGYVYDTNSTPLFDGEVALIEMDQWGNEDWRSWSDTTPDGYYNLLSPTGTFYVRTEDFGDYIVDRYYTNAFIGNIEEATPVIVTTNGVTNINFYLSTGARIEGMVQDPDMNPVSWGRVKAYNQDEECIGEGYVGWEGSGEFGFAVPAGSNVTVRTEVDYGQWYPRTWHGNTCSRDLATTLSLTNGQTRGGLNIQVFPGYEVHGFVQSQSGGVGIVGAGVTAFDIASNQYDIVGTDGSGNYYSLYVPTNVALGFFAGAVGFEGEFYDDVYNPANATAIQTSAYNHVNVEFVLYATGLDTDNDGIPDSEEDTVPNGNYDAGTDYSNPADPDTDDDGVDDGDEQVAGTDPQDGDSLFGIVETDPGEDGLFLLWSSVSGRQYNVQECTNLAVGVWSNIYTVTATAENTSYTNGMVAGRGFYRVQVSGQ